jgi:Type I phosphodiesterase / nucleotide pyrophosphatase
LLDVELIGRHISAKLPFSAVVAAYLVVASCLALTTAQVLHSRSGGAAPLLGSLTSSSAVPPKYLVLMVLDGGRPDYFGLTSLPHVDALRAQGTQFTNAVDGILEAETPAGHATIATGSRPDRDGILGFDWANDNDRYSLFDPSQMTNLEQILQDSHAPTIAGLYKQQYPQAKVVALSGHKYYAAAPLGGPSADAIIYYQGDPKGRYVPVAVPGHTPPASLLSDPTLIASSTKLPDGAEDHLATKMALAVARTMKPRMLLINYPEFDWPLGHVDGGSADPAKVITDMKVFDSDLGLLEDAYRKAGILDQTLFVITADHGMMPITHFVPSSEISNAIAQAGTSAPDIASSSGDYVWLADSSKAQAVAENIVNVHDTGIQSVYYLTAVNGTVGYQTAAGSGVSADQDAVNRYLLDGLINGHEPQVVVFGTEGSSFSDPKMNWKGDHGGNSWQSQHIPLILAGPGIKAGVQSDAPVQLDDVAPTVLTDMGVRPTGMEGRVLGEALTYPPSPAAKDSRLAEDTQLRPFVNALSRE